VRFLAALALVAAALSGCGSSGGEPRVERCVDRLLSGTPSDARSDGARRYVRETYCERFERSGWVYADGALSIRAHTWLEIGGMCAAGGEGTPTRTVPCEDVRESGPRRLDCGLLRHVRRAEVRSYLERQRREQGAVCDDGTALDTLGVP
jgi:hypothetical protein